MKAQILEYDANKPIPKQIVVPTNSEYAIGIKVTKDGKVIDSGLTIGGVEPIKTIGDYNIFCLSSDSTEGMKQLELEVNKLPQINTTLTKSYRITNSSANVVLSKLYPGSESLSAFGIDREIELNGSDISVSFTDYGTTASHVLPQNVLVFTDITTSTPIAHYIFDTVPSSNSQAWMNDYVGKFWLVDDAHTVVDSIKVDQNSNINNTASVRRGTKLYCDSVVSINYGLQAKFPLYIQQKDLGYIEIADNSANTEPTPEPEEPTEPETTEGE